MKRIMRKVMAWMLAAIVFVSIPTVDTKAAIKYSTYKNTRFTYTVKYPTTFQRADYSSGDGTKLISKDGKAKASIWNSYGGNKKRNGKTVVATAKKNRNAVTIIRWGKIRFSIATSLLKTERLLFS